MRLLLLLTFFGILFSSGVTLADNLETQGLDETDPLKAFSNLFRKGTSVEVGFTGQYSTDQTTETMKAIYRHGYEGGSQVTITLPLSLEDPNPGVMGSTTPRIDGRFSVSGNYRIWGDMSDYFAMGARIELPVQNQLAYSNTIYGYWASGLSAFGRFEKGKFAFEPGLTVISTFSGNTSNSSFVDSTNPFILNLQADYYLNPRLAATFCLAEYFGTSISGSLNRSVYISDQASEYYGNSHQNLTLGTQIAPFTQAFILTFNVTYNDSSSLGLASPLSFTERIRWDF